MFWKSNLRNFYLFYLNFFSIYVFYYFLFFFSNTLNRRITWCFSTINFKLPFFITDLLNNFNVSYLINNFFQKFGKIPCFQRVFLQYWMRQNRQYKTDDIARHFLKRRIEFINLLIINLPIMTPTVCTITSKLIADSWVAHRSFLTKSLLKQLSFSISSIILSFCSVSE